MKVGTDGVLLGAWCNVGDASHVLDIGCGTGLIALMVAQRNQQAMIDAVEIDTKACEEARYNVENSPWHNRINIINEDFTKFSPDSKKYGLIVSNPPYFSAGILPPDRERMLARHCATLTYHNLIVHSMLMLSPVGRICIITPADVEMLIKQIVASNSLSIHKMTFVRPKPSSEIKRILWEISPVPAISVVEELTIETETHHEYTNQYISLTKDFYLKM